MSRDGYNSNQNAPPTIVGVILIWEFDNLLGQINVNRHLASLFHTSTSPPREDTCSMWDLMYYGKKCG